MKITRHPVDLEHVRAVFQRNVEELPEWVRSARRTSQTIGPLGGSARTIFRTGSVVSPDASEVAYAIRVAAQANTACLIFASITDPPQFIELGDGPSVTYAEPVDQSYAHVGQWIDGFELATISRQDLLLEALQGVPNEVMLRSSTWGEESTYLWLDLLRALGTEPQVTRHPAFAAYERFCDDCRDRSALCKSIRHLHVPYLEVLRQLDSGNAETFSDALREALLMHRKFFSSTEKLRKEFMGFVSVSLTAVAALAWDRGLRFDVESDYTPRSWVTGELFRQRHEAGSSR